MMKWIGGCLVLGCCFTSCQPEKQGTNCQSQLDVKVLPPVVALEQPAAPSQHLVSVAVPEKKMEVVQSAPTQGGSQNGSQSEPQGGAQGESQGGAQGESQGEPKEGTKKGPKEEPQGQPMPEETTLLLKLDSTEMQEMVAQ
ncbi:MAG: hypothetical protein KGI80_04325 [Verrucomicrobiota bacterium]|nr:hypothetical protein [Verrucomicrobiota bacterium]